MKWEYWVEILAADDDDGTYWEANANEAGHLYGFELVAVVKRDNGDIATFFKRPVPDKEAQP